MITFTKEQLIASAHARIEFAEMMLAGELEPLKERTWSIELELARIALASLEAEPVAWTWEIYGGGNMYAKIKPESLDARPLYTAPPSPVSVPAAYEHTEDFSEYHDGWNACRSAMLQGAYGNSPVIQDGWVMVPVEPTKEMIDAGWSYYMTTKSPSSLGVYGAMLAAAPQQEDL